MIPEGSLYTENSRLAGEIAEHLPGEYIDTHRAQGLVPFGVLVVRGSAADQAKAAASVSDTPLGVAGRSIQARGLDDERYEDGDVLGTVREGIVMVRVEEAVDPSSPVRVRHANEEPDDVLNLGCFRTSAESGKTARVSNAEFRGTVTGAGVVALWVQGPMALTADQ